MNRIRAVLCVGLGLALVGVAVGLLYMDVREHEAVHLLVQAKDTGTTTEQKTAAAQAWQKSDRVIKAMFAGASGAALVGMGLMLFAFEMRAFRREGLAR